MPKDQPVKIIICPVCKARHYHGEPCPRCYHQAKDIRDSRKAQKALTQDIGW